MEKLPVTATAAGKPYAEPKSNSHNNNNNNSVHTKSNNFSSSSDSPCSDSDLDSDSEVPSNKSGVDPKKIVKKSGVSSGMMRNRTRHNVEKKNNEKVLTKTVVGSPKNVARVKHRQRRKKVRRIKTIDY